MFTGPVGPVEVFFYWPEAVFGNFYWPGAIGSPLASSPGLEETIFLIENKITGKCNLNPSNANRAIIVYSTRTQT